MYRAAKRVSGCRSRMPVLPWSRAARWVGLRGGSAASRRWTTAPPWPLTPPSVPHARRVVEDDDVQRVLRAGEGQCVPQESGQEQAGKQDQHDPQEQQDELLDDQPAAVFLLRLEQEFHRRPLDPAVAEAVD